jgi:hypothetical protein
VGEIEGCGEWQGKSQEGEGMCGCLNYGISFGVKKQVAEIASTFVFAERRTPDSCLGNPPHGNISVLF